MSAAPATAADIYFCWVGAGGYTLTGHMDISEDAMNKSLVTESDVTAFKIIGYHDGTRVGTWALAQRTPDTTWHLRFDPASLTFLTGGSFATDRSQGWNADGTAANCGDPGFGFNSGNAGQDVCLNGNYVAQSTITPETPFIASRVAVAAACQQKIPLSKR